MRNLAYAGRSAAPDLGRGLAAGPVGGAAGSLVMMAAQAALARSDGLPIGGGEDDVAQDAGARRGPAGGPDPSPVQAARALARTLLDRDVPERHERAAGRLRLARPPRGLWRRRRGGPPRHPAATLTPPLPGSIRRNVAAQPLAVPTGSG